MPISLQFLSRKKYMEHDSIGWYFNAMVISFDCRRFPIELVNQYQMNEQRIVCLLSLYFVLFKCLSFSLCSCNSVHTGLPCHIIVLLGFEIVYIRLPKPQFTQFSTEWSIDNIFCLPFICVHANSLFRPLCNFAMLQASWWNYWVRVLL